MSSLSVFMLAHLIRIHMFHVISATTTVLPALEIKLNVKNGVC